ncbi:hypothetical protein D3D02_00160 [Halobellus sp. Atlit-38R]|uniref:surface glycoprotein n=2 Tax=Haloferacaceae TaxID=1644056 RepID=UPI000EF1D37B|nr:surface glycoprotein [Halobellus sp. Atlit-38R]RLM94439.1 hypothetical protein D3D02_00160 [Halobellus sp. Atlit-38R]
MTRDLRNKARAVFLATLMVVSVFGGTMAFAGSAAATASGVDFDGQDTAVVTNSDDITISGDVTANDQDVTIYYDANDDGNKNAGETLTTVSAASIDGGTFTTTVAAPDEGDLTNPSATNVWVVQGSTISNTNSYSSNADEKVGVLTVDDTPVSFNENNLPAGNPPIYTTSTPEIRQNVTDAISGVDDETVQVTLRQNGDKYYSYEIGAQTTNDGVRYEDNNITIRPGVGDVPELEDGDYTASLSVTDKAGNTRQSTKLTFSVDTGPATFNLNSPDSVVDVNDPIVEVEVSDSNVDLANLTITNESGYSETFDQGDNVYGVDHTDTFTVDTGSDTSAVLPNGTITVEVNATDTAGNYAEDSYTFEVENIKPNVTNVQLSSSDINTQNDAGSETVTATFDEPVQPETVEAEVSIDGTTNRLTNVVDSNDANTEVSLEFDVSTYTTTNESAVVTVDSANDVAGNPLNNTANASFEIDTDTPGVNFNTMGDGDVISGYANITGNVTAVSNDDVDDVQSVNYYLLPGDSTYDEADDRSDLVSVSDPKNINTSAYPDGVHTLVVYVTDNASNEGYNSKALTIDNNEPSLSYDQDATLTGEVDISTFLTVNNVGTEDVNYLYKYSGSDGDFNDGETFQDATTFDVNTLGEGKYILRAVANDPGFEGADASDDLDTVELEGKKLSLADPNPGVVNGEDDGFDISADGDTLTINVTTDIALDRLNVSVATSDNFRTQSSDVLELDDGDFTQVDSENGYKYVATSDDVDDLSAIVRDGAFTATFKNASAGDQRLDETDVGGAGTAMTAVDTANATVTDADVVSADKDQLNVRVRFSEPVSSIGSVSDFNGYTVSKMNAGDDATDGVVNYTVEGMAQTGGDAELTFSDVTEQQGAPHTTDSTSADVTFSLELSEGVNVVSVPAETGEVPIDSLDLAGVNSIWEYNDGEWTKHVVEPDNGDLTSLKGGLGYIVNASEDTEIDYEVENTPVTGVERNNEPIEAGWNLVGHYQEGSQNVDQAFIGLTGVWGVEDYAGNQPTSLSLEQGYWLHTNTAGSHVPIAYDGPQSEQPNVYNVVIDDNDENDDVVQAGEKISVTAEVEDSSNIQSVTVTGGAEFGAKDSVELQNTGGTTYSATLDPTEYAFTGQSASLLITAVDTDGNAGYGSDTVTVNNDNQIDNTNIVSPTSKTPMTVGTSETLTVTYDAEDTNFKDATVRLLADNGDRLASTTVEAGGTDLTADFDLSSSALDIGAGTYDVQLVVNDTNTNSNSVTEADSVDVDAGIDNTNIVSPTSKTPMTVGASETLTVTYDAEDTNFKDATVRLLADNGDRLASTTVEAGGTDLTADFDLSSSALDIGAGTYDVQLVVNDTKSNSNTVTEADSVDVDGSVDVTDVQLSNTENDLTVTVKSDEDLSAISADVAGQTLTLSSDFSEDATNPYTYTATVAGVADGDYSVDVTQATDQYSNSVDVDESADAGDDESVTVNQIDTAAIDSPTSASTSSGTPGDSVSVTYDAQDSQAITVNVKLVNDQGTAVVTNSGVTAGTDQTTSLDTTDIETGTYDVVLEITEDSSDNSETVTQSDAVTLS